MKYFGICNPTAGRGKGRLILKRLQEALQRDGHELDFVETTAHRHAVAIAERVGREAVALKAKSVPQIYQAIIGIGGDGTIGEIAEGLLRSTSSLPLACVFAGRGNDYGRSLGLTKPVSAGAPALELDPFEAQYKAIVEGYTTMIDVARVEYNDQPAGYMINGFGFGATAIATEIAHRFRRLGKVAYMIGAFALFLNVPKPHTIELRIDDQPVECFETQDFSILNGQTLGGGFIMGPESDLRDGVLELGMVYKKIGRFKLAHLVKKFRQGTQYQDATFAVRKGHRMEVWVQDRPAACHKDGECFDQRATHLRFEVEDRRLKLCVPKAVAELFED